MRYFPAQSRHDSGVCACLVESGLYLSILVYQNLYPRFGLCLYLFFISCFYFSCFYFSLLLLISFFRSLVRLASLSSLFSPLGTCRRVQHGQYSAVVSRRSA